MKLTRPLILPIGINALGGMQIFVGLAPLAFSSGAPKSTARRLLFLLAGAVVVTIDLWWRLTDVEHGRIERLVSPSAGGAVVYLPGWLYGLAVITLVHCHTSNFGFRCYPILVDVGPCKKYMLFD